MQRARASTARKLIKKQNEVDENRIWGVDRRLIGKFDMVYKIRLSDKRIRVRSCFRCWIRLRHRYPPSASKREQLYHI